MLFRIKRSWWPANKPRRLLLPLLAITLQSCATSSPPAVLSCPPLPPLPLELQTPQANSSLVERIGILLKQTSSNGTQP